MAEELILRVDLHDAVKDLELIENTVKDYIIPITMCSATEVSSAMGIQPCFTLMNKEYIQMKMTAIRWLRNKDFIVDHSIDVNSVISIRYYTEHCEDNMKMIIEIRMKSKYTDEKLLNKKRSFEDDSEDICEI